MADTLALLWPRTADGPLRGAAVSGAGAVGPTFEAPGPVTGEGLKAALAAAGVTAKRTVVALPRPRATVRRLDLPAVGDDELPALVRMQAATKSAAPLDQLALDFLPLPATDGGEGPAGRSALLATVPAALLTEVQTVVAAAGLNLASVGLTPVGAARLVAGRAPGEGTTLIVSRDGAFAELTLLAVGPDGPRLIHSHAAHPADDGGNLGEWERSLLSECSRVLIAHGGSGDLAGVWALGEGADAIAPRLADLFGGTPHAASTWDALGLTGETAGSGPGVLGGAVGLAVGPAAGAAGTPSLDFLAPRRPPVPQDHRLRNGLLAAAALTVLIGGGWFLLDRQRSTLQASIDRVNGRIKSDEAFVKEHEPLLVEDNALSGWAAETVHPHDELARLDALLPGTDRLFLETFQLIPPTTRGRAAVLADGFAADGELVRQMERDLAAAGYVVLPTKTARVTGRPGYPVRFSLSAELPPDQRPPDQRPPDQRPTDGGSSSRADGAAV